MQLIITCNGDHINTHYATLGKCNDRLSEKWILESLRLAKALKEEEFDFIFCSDFWYRRTTADLIVQELVHQHFQIIVDPNLREKDADICNNLTKENLLKQEKTIESNNTEILNRLFIKQDSIGGLQNTSESQNEVLSRVQAFLHDLTHQYPSTAKVLVVGSPIVNSYLITLLLWKEDSMCAVTTPCSISRFQRLNERWIQESFNERQHLYGPNSF